MRQQPTTRTTTIRPRTTTNESRRLVGEFLWDSPPTAGPIDLPPPPLFFIFLLLRSPRRFTAANDGQRRPTKANAGQRRPTAANAGQCRPTKTHGSQRRPTKASAGPRRQKGPKRRV